MNKKILRWLSSSALLGSVLLSSILLSITLLSCSGQPNAEKELKVAASAVPHAQMLEFIQPDLHQKGIDLTIIVTDDFQIPNRALADKEVDANFFQHLPFLQEQVQYFHYPIHSLASIELEPMGIYATRIKTLEELPQKARIAIPNDPTNEARALLLFQAQGLIELQSDHTINATLLDIAKNPKKLQFVEVDAAMLPRLLADVDAAAINTNYALQAHLSPLHDALALEGKDSPYANIIAIREGEEKREAIEALKQAMTSEKMRQFILENYHGAILPAF